MDIMRQALQSADEDGESIAEKLDIFPASRSGYTQKVTLSASTAHASNHSLMDAHSMHTPCAQLLGGRRLSTDLSCIPRNRGAGFMTFWGYCPGVVTSYDYASLAPISPT